MTRNDLQRATGKHLSPSAFCSNSSTAISTAPDCRTAARTRIDALLDRVRCARRARLLEAAVSDALDARARVGEAVARTRAGAAGTSRPVAVDSPRGLAAETRLSPADRATE